MHNYVFPVCTCILACMCYVCVCLFVCVCLCACVRVVMRACVCTYGCANMRVCVVFVSERQNQVITKAGILNTAGNCE